MKNFLNILKKNRLIKSIYSIFNHISQKKITKFQIIFTAYFFIFSLFLFFSVPSVYDFNKFERQIVEKIDSVYKLKILNILNCGIGTSRPPTFTGDLEEAEHPQNKV